MALLYGRAGRVTAKNDGFRPGQNFSYGGARLLVGGAPAAAARPCEDLTVEVTVTNSGRRAGAEVVQVYVAGANATSPSGHVAPAHVRALAAFARTEVLAPGATVTVKLAVPHAALSVIVVGMPAGPLAPGALAPTARVVQVMKCGGLTYLGPALRYIW